MKMTMAFCTIWLGSALMAGNVPPAETQIAAAILAAPAELRAGAAVLGYNAEGKLGTLREGSNEMICLASDPAKTSFSVACYHKDLEPYMARGRELLAQKVTGQKRNDIRWSSIEKPRLRSTRIPSFVPAIISSSDDSPGTMQMFVIRTSGTRCQPSARAQPVDDVSSAPADSRPAM